MVTFLAIDPGTYKMGVVLFNDAQLIRYWLCEAPRGMEIEERLPTLVNQLEEIVLAHGEVRAIACEKLIGHGKRLVAPELQTLIRRIRRWATKTPHKFIWWQYHPSTIVAQIRPAKGGYRKDWTPKDIMRLGVKMVYGSKLGSIDQNLIDAIAVGHCHIEKRRAAEILEEREI